ncbi:MAG: hypothetical protein A2268_06205 [Candidatus Raymondbacteria bacterium RifOxyA12_full_50_37]|uniref:Fibronectin type-III domain-containing protein n=1 Tax=Candidatus Raymondbacteria bacterium RIFOXYD12_FULL_49_13 TaxID=1817890 RepID=A0A1F7FKN7_UNCRA|nr:MAG: hypothetical protein A2268_06205 [Candidatus Raymondbacteria bacterium RifOxyA12_full_50_37]OGJ94561.1 MAG: hypothetical protein A2248_15135 [Candidatus Raymondbacteria bacterium RIFOXYA2_FULL_49_16]OGJ95889.1 MAG: hypothetical protein A2487_02930 [Candidatus Raymondbacteria bacterium RifOxyC12_full_50_8]OGK01710.1 MAG: hypothetical protein A2350_10865 [Candidatus Raymondbacteria bacterium RifOxyB12_full_50_8]OGK07037.1 MAG: hypothetical protein A2519_13775 [Candidatus Raymondbacteria b
MKTASCSLIAIFILSLYSFSSLQALIIPRPKEYTDLSSQWTISSSDGCAIVLGNSASQQEHYAAECFQQDFLKRFEKTVDIITESAAPGGYAYVFYFGTATSNGKINALKTLDISALPADGFIIEMAMDGVAKAALVGGADVNGVIYGQNSLFQLFEKSDSSIIVHRAAVRDWPSIKMRIHTRYLNENFYNAGVFKESSVNCIARSRQNAVILEYASDNYDTTQSRTIIQEVEKRGLSTVWAVIGLRVDSAAQLDAKIAIMRKLYGFGIDNFYLRYNDRGSWDGPGPEIAFPKIFAFTDSVGIPDSNLLFLPTDNGKAGSYESPDRADNDSVLAKTARLKNVRWVFTSTPKASTRQICENMGFVHKPSWWYNWTRIAAGFTHMKYGLTPYPEGSDGLYHEIPNFDESSWFNNDNSMASLDMREADQNIDAVHLWMHRNVVEDYLALIYGFWAWNPNAYNFNEVSQYIHETVFGKDKVAAAHAFDSALHAIRLQFDPNWYDDDLCCGTSGPSRPFALNGSRDSAIALAITMMNNLEILKGAKNSLIDSVRFVEQYLSQMQRTVNIVYDYMGLGEPVAYSDSTPPSNVSVYDPAIEKGMVVLRWNPAVDLESGIRSYKIYRGTSPDPTQLYRENVQSTAFSEEAGTESFTYYYRVKAVNGLFMESPEFSNGVAITIEADTIPPHIDTVYCFRKSEVKMIFNEPIDTALAQDIGNYTMDHDIGISSATLLSDNRTVVLSLASLVQSDTAYTLHVSNITDRAGSPNTIAANTGRTFLLQDIPRNGLVGRWMFDETSGGIAYDSSGYAHNGSINLPSRIAGNIGNALAFHGEWQYVRINTIPVDTAAGSRNTVSFWMKHGDNVTGKMVLGWYYDLSYSLIFKQNYFGVTTGDDNLFGLPAYLVDTGWTHVSVVFNNGTLSESNTQIYINGTMQNIKDCLINNPTTQGKKISATLYIGGVDWHSTPEKLIGALDELCVYNRALTPGEVLTLFNYGNGTQIPSIVAKTQEAEHYGLLTLQAYPNPFNPSINIVLSNMQRSNTHARIRLYDIQGHLIQHYSPQANTDRIKIVWDGRDTFGKNVASGMYILVVKADNKHFVRKLLLIR